MTPCQLAKIAREGLGFTPEEFSALTQQIDAKVTEASDRVGEAAAKKGADAAKSEMLKSAAIGVIGGGLLGFALTKFLK